MVEPIEPVDVVVPPERYLGMLIEDIKKVLLMGDRDQIVNPKIYDKVMSDINSEKWLNAMKLEIDLIHLNWV